MSKEELQAWIDVGQCWWCESPKVFKALSMHWTRAHHIDLQDIRDLLGVPKNTAFISDETRTRYIEHGRRFYDPDKLHNKGNSRAMSEYGRQVNRDKIAAMRSDPMAMTRMKDGLRRFNETPECREILKKASQVSNGRRKLAAKMHTCVICGVSFQRKGGTQRITCSEKCKKDRYAELARANPRFNRTIAEHSKDSVL